MPYKDQPRHLTHSAPKSGRVGVAYRRAWLVVRARVERGGRDGLCYFYRRPGHERCPGRIRLDLPANHALAFTAHHLQRIMDGGEAVPDPRWMVPAHRGCNSRDGLIGQNQRRARRGVKPPAIVRQRGAQQAGAGTPAPVRQDRTSQRW